MSFSFGTPSSAPATTGLTGGFNFGANKPATPGFGLTATSQPSTGLFGATPATSAPAFGTPFGSTSFGATTTPAFGTGAPAFGTNAPAPAFGTTAPAFGTTTPAFGAATAAPNFGTTPATGITGFAAPFGSTTTSSFGLGTGGLNFGTGTNTSAPSTGLSFGTPAATTTTPSLGGFGGPTFTGPALSTCFSLFPSTSANTSSSIFAPKPGGITTTQSTIGTLPSTSVTPSLGLGGAAHATSGIANANADAKSDPPKQQKLPNEIASTVEIFKDFVKKQKSLSSEVMRVSVKPLHMTKETVMASDPASTESPPVPGTDGGMLGSEGGGEVENQASILSHTGPIGTDPIPLQIRDITRRNEHKPRLQYKPRQQYMSLQEHETVAAMPAAMFEAILGSENPTVYTIKPDWLKQQSRNEIIKISVLMEVFYLLQREGVIQLPDHATFDHKLIRSELAKTSKSAFAKKHKSHGVRDIDVDLETVSNKSECQQVFGKGPSVALTKRQRRKQTKRRNELLQIFYHLKHVGMIKLPDYATFEPAVETCIATIHPRNKRVAGKTVCSELAEPCVSLTLPAEERDSHEVRDTQHVHEAASDMDNKCQPVVENSKEQSSVSPEPQLCLMDAGLEETEVSQTLNANHSPIWTAPGPSKGKGVGKGRKGNNGAIVSDVDASHAVASDVASDPAGDMNAEVSTQGAKRQLSIDCSLPTGYIAADKKLRLEDCTAVPVFISRANSCPDVIKVEDEDDVGPPSHILAPKPCVFVMNKAGIRMNSYRATLVRKTIQKAHYQLFRNNRSKPSEERKLPRFVQNPSLTRGCLRVVPEDDFALKWLISTVDKLPWLWNGSGGFKVIPESELPKYRTGVIYIPDFGEDRYAPAGWPFIIREYLSSLNQELNMDRWPIFTHTVRQRGQCYNHVLVMGIPPEDLEALKRKQFRLHYTMAKVFVKVSKEAEATLRMAMSLHGALVRTRAAAKVQRHAAVTAIAAAEAAARDHAHPGSELEGSAPPPYVKELIAELEQKLIAFRSHMDSADKQMQSSPKLLTEQELTLGFRRMHESLVALAGRLQGVHSQVEAQKEQYLNLRKYILKDPTDVFAAPSATSSLDQILKELDSGGRKKMKSGGNINLAGPSPFVYAGGFSPFPADNNTPAWQPQAAQPATTLGPVQTSGFGTSSESSVGFQLQKPPGKRGKQ